MYGIPNGLIVYSIYNQLLFRLDFEGNIIWKQKLEKGFVARAFDMRNDTMFIAGERYTSQGWKTDRDFFFRSYNINGDSLNTVYLGDDQKYETDMVMCPLKNGDFLFASRTSPISPSVSNLGVYDSLLVIRTNFKGKQYWKKTVATPNDSLILKNYRGGYIYDIGANKYFLAFDAYVKGEPYNQGSEYSSFGFWTKFDAEGKFESTRRFPSSEKELFIRLIPTSDGLFFGERIYQDSWFINNKPSQAIIMDHNLNYVKKGTLLGQNAYRAALILTRKELPNEKGFVSVGFNEENDSISEQGPLYGGGPWIVKFNKDAIMEWERVILDFRYIQSRKAGSFWGWAQMDNGDFILSGEIYRNFDKKGSTDDLWLVRVDSMGCPYPNCKGKLQAINNKTDNEEVVGELQGVKIMPNPTSGPLWFEIPDDLLQQAVTIQCFDLSGRKVYQRDFIATQSVFNLDIGDLSNGLYFVRIQDKNGRGCAKKILKEE
jgi:hypothetical protein